MNLVEKLKMDSENGKHPVLRMVAQRIIDLLEKWNENKCGSDYFIFNHTFKVNANLYKQGASLTREQFDKIDEIMEMLDTPKYH